MSNRSIVEFNHDYTHKIIENRDEFCTALIHALNGASYRHWEVLERYGARLAVTAHHSEDRKVVAYGREFVL